MDKDVAQMVANTAARVAMELGNLMPLLKEHAEAEDQATRLAIASAVCEIGLVEARIYDEFPDLKAAAETRLGLYGRSYY